MRQRVTSHYSNYCNILFDSTLISAVEAIRDHFASEPRDAAKIGYLITMSGSSYPILTQAHARAAAEEGLQLIEVGVGDGVNQENLQSLQVKFEKQGRPAAIM